MLFDEHSTTWVIMIHITIIFFFEIWIVTRHFPSFVFFHAHVIGLIKVQKEEKQFLFSFIQVMCMCNIKFYIYQPHTYTIVFFLLFIL